MTIGCGVHQPSRFGQVMRGMLPDAVGHLIEPAAEADQRAGVDQTREVDERDAGRLEVPRTRDAARSGEAERAFSVSCVAIAHDVPYRTHIVRSMDVHEHPWIFS